MKPPLLVLEDAEVEDLVGEVANVVGPVTGRHACGGDEAAYKSSVRELREGLDETGAPPDEPQAA